MTCPPDPSFHLFPLLPPELRLKIWRLTFHPRIVEVQLHVPPSPPSVDAVAPTIDLRPLVAPSVPVAFHASHESRVLALSLYRPCVGATFGSPHAFPYNLYRPALDTLFVPISLYSLEASAGRNMFSADAAAQLGTPREFVLGRMAVAGVEGGMDVREVQYLAISWQDMHVKDVGALAKALEPFEGLRELALVFFEMRRDYSDVRLVEMRRGRMSAVLLEPEEGIVRGRYLARVMDGFVEFAAAFNERFEESNDKREVDEGRARKMPKVKVKIVRFQPPF